MTEFLAEKKRVTIHRDLLLLAIEWLSLYKTRVHIVSYTVISSRLIEQSAMNNSMVMTLQYS